MASKAIKISDIDLVSTIGIEFTYISSPFGTTPNGDKLNMFKNLSFYNNASLDDGAIEIRSPVMRSVESLVGFYDYINQICDRLNLHQKILCSVDKGSYNYLPSGGGHMNFGIYHLPEIFPDYAKVIKEQGTDIADKIRNIIKLNPFILWIFGESHDNDILSSTGAVGKDYDHSVGETSYALDDGFDNVLKYEVEPSSRQARIELRFFDGYKDRQDLINCIYFGNALMKLAMNCNKEGNFDYDRVFDEEGNELFNGLENVPKKSETLSKYVNGSIDDSIKGFEEFCEMIDIDPSLFNDRIKYNLCSRYEAGQDYWKAFDVERTVPF